MPMFITIIFLHIIPRYFVDVTKFAFYFSLIENGSNMQSFASVFSVVFVSLFLSRITQKVMDEFL